jgi:hypothetical protein
MSDFKALPQVNQISIQVKLDGFIEACFHVTRVHNIGLAEAADLTIRALLRELAAHHLDPAKASAIWSAAAEELLPLTSGSAAQLN